MRLRLVAWSLAAAGLTASAQLVAQVNPAAPLATPPTALPAAPPTALPPSSRSATCERLAATVWPATTSGRAALLSRLEAARAECVDSPAFLALLGAAWLEFGDPPQALLWLERALMLDPTAPGARADHALALAAMDEPSALRDLIEQWRDRTDIPAALINRMVTAHGRIGRGHSAANPGAAAANAPAAAAAAGWTWRRELALFYGHESNLDHSPRLTELTLSAPDGPITLPLAVAIEPRAGSAWLIEGGLQSSYRPGGDVQWQGGLQWSARLSPNQPDTDQRQAQVALARIQRFGDWRGQLQVGAGWQGGPLSDPYRTTRFSAAAEREWLGCGLRLGSELELRRQRSNPKSDGVTAALLGNSDCSTSWISGWTWGLGLRAGLDRPRDSDRPGGSQRQYALGWRAAGPIGAGFRLETAARLTWLSDVAGYDPLFESNAARRQVQRVLSIEVSRAMPANGLPPSELVVQVQRVRQTSNISLFGHSGTSAFAGVRFGW